jgi:hypothetical protein
VPCPLALPKRKFIHNYDSIDCNQRYYFSSISITARVPRSQGRREREGGILRISVRTLVIRFMSLLLILASPPELAPKDASGTLFDQPTTWIY